MANLRVNKIAAVGVSTENTGSVFFDGTGDNLVSKSSGLAPGSGNFTAEGWFNLPSTSGISNSSLFSSGIEPVLHWALVSSGGAADAAQSEPDTWNRIDAGVGTYAAGFLYQDTSTLILLDVGINTTSVTLDFSTELDEDFYYPGWLVSNDFVNNGWINKGAVNTDADGVVTLTDSTPFRYVKMRSLTNLAGNVATLQGYSPLDGADYAAWGVRRSSDNGNAYLYNGGDWVDSGLSISQDTWNHVAVVRDSSAMNLYVNGTGYALTSYSNSNLSNSVLSVSGFNTSGNVVVDPLRGYASNVRLTLGEKLYTSGYAEPTDELNVIGGTAFVGCYDGENIFAEKTGKVIAAYGDRLSSPTPTATDSPIGITTFNPGLTRSVDATAGPTFQGGAGFVSQNWLTLPKGTTEERFPNFATNAVSDGSARGVFGGGDPHVNTVEYITIATLGNGTDFGDLTRQSGALDGNGCASRTRGIISGGSLAPSTSSNTNIIDYITIASPGNATNFGDLTQARQQTGGISNSTRAVFAGGYTPSAVTTIDYVTIATTGDATDYGDLLQGFYATARGASPVRGVVSGSNSGGAENSISYMTIATTGNAKDFGDLSESRFRLSGCSNSTRAVFGGGITPSNTQTIEFITISTSGNGQDFGDLYKHNQRGNTASSSTRGIFAGGAQPFSGGNVIQYIAIPTTGNSVDFGDLINGRKAIFGLSNAHGGLG